MFEFNLDVNGIPTLAQASGTLEIEFKEKWEIRKNAPNTPDHLKGEDWSEW